jgi:hypothetical protein
MGEISAASNEQSLGVSQVGEAVSQMDQTTQQNAALVEQMAAAASSLKAQAQELVQVVAAFDIGNSSSAAPATAHRAPPAQTAARSVPAYKPAVKVAGPAPKRASAPAPKLTTIAKPQTAAKATPAGGDDDWETF